MILTTRDYQQDRDGEPGAEPMVCADCHRPAYYDYGDEAYHHALDPARGCFLIAAEDRPDDHAHPLVLSPEEVAAVVAEYDRLARLNTTDDYDAIGEVIEDRDGEVPFELCDVAHDLGIADHAPSGDILPQMYDIARYYRERLRNERSVDGED